MAIKFWRRLCVATCVAAFLVGSPAYAVAAGFFRSIDDLPVAPGLAEAVEQGIEFDSPSGRIVTAVAQSPVGADARIETVRLFYRKALPPLGWVPVSDDTYLREGERLTLHFEIAGKRAIVRIRLVPAGAK